MPGVRGDVTAVQRLLEQVAGAADADSHGHRPVQAILGGARAFTDVAAWNAQVLDHLASAGQLHLPGRLLNGGEVTNHVALVEAKLADRMVSASTERLEPLRTAYQAAQNTGAGTAHASDHVTPTVKPPTQGPVCL